MNDVFNWLFEIWKNNPADRAYTSELEQNNPIAWVHCFNDCNPTDNNYPQNNPIGD